MTKAAEQIDRLIAIMDKLRSENGCPWDREQDLRSLRPYLIEEAYEVLEQLDQAGKGSSMAPLRDELGDLLFQIVFHSKIAAEKGEFDLSDVIQAICDKIEFRHPHVFGSQKTADAMDVAQQWAKLKAEERRRKTGNPGSAIEGVPKPAPALMRAERIGEKASRVGFDWKKLEDVRAKVDEELAELDRVIAGGSKEDDAENQARIEEELGDVLFSIANLARWLKCHPEDALRGSIDRFIARFQFIENRLNDQGRSADRATLEEMDALWNEAKLHVKRQMVSRDE